MRVRIVGDRALVRGEVGDRLPEALVQTANEQGWKSGSLSGLGGVRNVKLAYFDLDRREYVPINVEGIVELVTLLGNLAIVDGKPFWHLHASVSDRNGLMTAGHLVSLEVAVTLECCIAFERVLVSRRRDEVSGFASSESRIRSARAAADRRGPQPVRRDQHRRLHVGCPGRRYLEPHPNAPHAKDV